jgi:anti-sigma factor RsiW
MHLEATGHAAREAIVAYVDGTASREVASHIQGCPTCSADASALQTTQSRLRQALFRFDCPEPHRLGEYELGVVSPQERVEIARHVLECAYCADELQTLREFLRAEPPLRESLVSGVRRVLATLLAPSPSFGLAGVRGADTELRQYQAEGARLSIGAGPEPGSLIGLLVPAQPGQARLTSEDGQPHATEVDDLGNFEFEDVPAGSYQLEIELPDEIIVVEGFAID